MLGNSHLFSWERLQDRLAIAKALHQTDGHVTDSACYFPLPDVKSAALLKGNEMTDKTWHNNIMWAEG
jgi:hypothetical protein